MSHATTWMNFENIKLNNQSQAQKKNTLWFHLHEVPKVVELAETESRIVGESALKFLFLVSVVIYMKFIK